MYTYTAYGLGIRSELPLPELVAAEAPPDIAIRLGEFSHLPPTGSVTGTTPAGNDFWVKGEDACFFREEVGAFLLKGGREVIVRPAPEVEDRVLRLFLWGMVLSTTLHMRGLLVLHGSAVAVNGGAVGFLGGPGYGKSTTAAMLHSRGHPMLSDDVLVIDLGGSDGPMVRPAFPQFKLWPEAAEALGEDAESLPQLHPGMPKRARLITSGFAQAPVPLDRLFLLDIGESRKIEALRPQEVVMALLSNAYWLRIFDRPVFGKEANSKHFAQCSELARLVPVRRLSRPRALDELVDLATFVEDDVAQAV